MEGGPAEYFELQDINIRTNKQAYRSSTSHVPDTVLAFGIQHKILQTGPLLAPSAAPGQASASQAPRCLSRREGVLESRG